VAVAAGHRGDHLGAVADLPTGAVGVVDLCTDLDDISGDLVTGVTRSANRREEMTTTREATRGGARVRIQRFGIMLSNMIMPSIGAIIAWGLITAFFIPDGWTPNEKIATVVGPTIFYVLPTLIAYTGGMIVYGVRGGVVGATSLIGVIMATSDPLFIGDQGGSPMFLGAMIMGPLTAYLMKRADALWHHKIKPGFEMLVNNFSAGILAAVMVVVGMFAVAPVLRVVMGWLADAVNFLVDNGLLPLTSLFIEPAKVLFLNNAINHGVLTPLGIDEAAETGKSVLFLLEANPGPGLGLLLAYSIFGRGVARATAPGAAIIQFFGGIHEVYFPFVLMKPKMILATIAGGMIGIFLFTAFEVGLRAPAAPGSIFAVYAQTPGGDFVGITAGVFGAAAVLPPQRGSVDSPITSIVFACDAGMGSSAMGASVLRRKITEAGFGDVTVVNQAISNLSDEYDLVVVHADLSDRACERTPSAAHVTVENFMNSPGTTRSSRCSTAPTSRPEPRRAWRPMSPLTRGSSPSARWCCPGARTTATTRSPRRVGCWSRRARSTRRTSTRCTSGSGRCPPRWATCWPSRMARTRRRTPCTAPPCPSSGTTMSSTGPASR
jgi:PTS system mannitol-specific IIC component